MVHFRTPFLTLAALVAALYAVPAEAQTGRITGTVRDYRGLAVSAATVAVTNQATGASSRTTTGADGSFTVSGLAPGAYTVSALLVGMRRMVHSGRRWGDGLGGVRAAGAHA